MPKYEIKLEESAEKIATRKSFGEALVKLGGKYKNIVVLDADLSCSVQTSAFAREFPERHFQMGIAEQNMVGTAAGLATRGKLPFACSFSIFVTGRAWEVVRNAICYPNLNVKIVGSHAGVGIGEDGASHQALEDIAVMRVLPNMKIVCPADHFEALSVMEAVANDYGPTYIRVNRQATSVIYGGVGGGLGGEKDLGGIVGGKEAGSGKNLVNFRFGKSDILFGKELFEGGKAEKKSLRADSKTKADVCIFATGALVDSSLSAALKLKEEDKKKVIVVNVSCLKPVDEKRIVECALGSKICVTAEDHSVIGGLAGAVSEVLAENGIGKKLFRIGIQDRFGESGKSADLYKKYGFDVEGVYKSVKRFIS